MRHFTEETTIRRVAAAASRQLVGGWWDTFDDYETCAYAMILPSGPWSTNAIIACQLNQDAPHAAVDHDAVFRSTII